MYKKNGNNKIYSTTTLNSSDNSKNLKISSQLCGKQRNNETLVEATSRGNYSYWLTHDDLTEIIRLDYNNYACIVRCNKKYEILAYPSNLSKNLEKFLLKTKELTETRLTLIIQFENLHWVALVISGRQGNYIAYYTDSKNLPMPYKYYQLLFDHFKIQSLSLNPGFVQQSEDYNCGLWALENAANLNRMLDESRPLAWLITKLQLPLSKEYFKRKRHLISEKLNNDPGWRIRHSVFSTHSRFKRSDTEPVEKKSKIQDLENKVREQLDFFCQFFVSAFIKRLAIYYITAKGERLTIEALKAELKTGIVAGLVDFSIAQIGLISLPSLANSIRTLSSQYYLSRDKAQKITKAFETASQETLSQSLTLAAIEIFQSFEAQFMHVTDKAGDKMAMDKLAEDAAGRALNYIAESSINKVISSEQITKGIILGDSEKFFDPNVKKARVRVSGNVVQDSEGNSINTSSLYEKIGFIVDYADSSLKKKYYINKDKPESTKYGYRRLLSWEKGENNDLNDFYQTNYIQETLPTKETLFQYNLRRYDYLLRFINVKQESSLLLNKYKNIDSISTEIEVDAQPIVKKLPVIFDLRKPVENFTGRTAILNELHEILSADIPTTIITKELSDLSLNPSSTSHTHSNILQSAICGLGGIGKTQLALRYAELYSETYDQNVIWINAETKNDLSNSLKKLASKLIIETKDKYGEEKELEYLIEEIYMYFSTEKSLFIFDNVENYKKIEPFLPKSYVGNKPTILLTSRYNNWGSIAKTVLLDVFNEEETIHFIKKELKIQDNTQNEKIKELNSLLQGLPLAIQQAMAYITIQRNINSQFNISDYIKLYKEKTKELLKFDFYNYNNNFYTKTVLITWEITLDKIKQDQKSGKLAIEILNIMAYICPDNIGNAMFLPLENNDLLASAIHLLKSYSMINQGSQQDISVIHRLVQQVIRIQLEINPDELKKTAEKILFLIGDYTNNKENMYHYLHFLLNMNNHSKLTQELNLKVTQKKILDVLIYSEFDEDSLVYWFDTAKLLYSKKKYLEFIGEALFIYTQYAMLSLMNDTMDYIEKKLYEGKLSKDDVREILDVKYQITNEHYKARRFSSNPEERKRQFDAITLLYQFQHKQFPPENSSKCSSSNRKKRNINSRCLLLNEEEESIEKQATYEYIKQHFKKVAFLSRTINSSLIAKDILSDLLQGNFREVAINFGVITSNAFFGKISNNLLLKGKDLAQEASFLEKDFGLENRSILRILFDKEVLSVWKRQFLGEVMQISSPFVARITSIFLIYNLKTEIQSYKMGDKAAIPDIISNGIIVGIDGIEAGIEGAEFLEIITGISDFTGPIGEGIALFAWLGAEMYTSEQQVKDIKKYVSLSRTEQVVEFFRAFFHMSPSEYLQIKARNEQLIEQAILFLKGHIDIKRYIFPSFNSEMALYNDSMVFLDKKRHIELDESIPDGTHEGHLFCLSGTSLPCHSIPPISNYRFSYLCKHAIGIEYPLNRTDDVTLIALGSGNQEVVAEANSSTVFIIENGQKFYKGGDKVNVFDLNGNSTVGLLHGGLGINILALDKFHPEKHDYLLIDENDILCGKNDSVIQNIPVFCSYNESKIRLIKINQIRGRNNHQDVIYLNNDIREIDGGGGKNNEYPDIFFITDRSYKSPRFILRNNTIILFLINTLNSVEYLIPEDESGLAKIQLRDQEVTQHRFIFERSIENIQEIIIKNNTINILLGISDSRYADIKSFKLTISAISNTPNKNKDVTSLTKNISYFFQYIEIKLLNNEQIYLKEQIANNKTIDEKISLFSNFAKKIEKTLSLQLFNNSTILIGENKSEIFYINGLFESYLIGNGGENVYIISPCKNSTFPLAPITLYNDTLKEDYNELTGLRNTLDLRELVKEYKKIYPDAVIFSHLFRGGEDLYLSLINGIYSPSRYSKNLNTFDTLVTIRLKNAGLDNHPWYKKLDIFIDNSIPNNIVFFMNDENEIWSLLETPLTFESDKKIIVITDKDIGNRGEIFVLKNIGNFIFFHTEKDLILTNISTTFSDVCTIILADYKIPDMRKKIFSTIFKFLDIQFRLQDYQYEIEHAEYFSDEFTYENVTITPSFLNLMNRKVSSDDELAHQDRRKRQILDENIIDMNTKKSDFMNEFKLINQTYVSQSGPYFQSSRVFDEERILMIADNYQKKYRDFFFEKKSFRFKKKFNKRKHLRQINQLISNQEKEINSNQNNKYLIYGRNNLDYQKRTISEKYVRHTLESSKAKLRTESLIHGSSFSSQSKPFSQPSRAFDKERILMVADNYQKKYRDFFFEKKSFRFKKILNKNNPAKQVNPLILTQEKKINSNQNKKYLIYNGNNLNNQRKTISEKYAQHRLKTSIAKPLTGNPTHEPLFMLKSIKQKKFFKNIFVQDKQISFFDKNLLNFKEGFKDAKTKQRLSYQQSESKSQQKRNQYTTQLSRIDVLPNFNETLIFFQLVARKFFRNPVSHSFNRKIKSNILDTQISEVSSYVRKNLTNFK